MARDGEKPWETVFKEGRFGVDKPRTIRPAKPIKPLLLTFPTQSGEYPVLLFFHGFMIPNTAYTQLLTHISSHGYITVAPHDELKGLPQESAEQEIDEAELIIKWLPDRLSDNLPDQIRPDMGNVGIAGHSRGGKVAFGSALRLAAQKTKIKLSALVGIDPVDGKDCGQQTDPHILTYKPHSFHLDIPTLVIGSGLGSKCKPASGPFRVFPPPPFVYPPCAPEGVSHREFFRECPSPSYHFVASEFGHTDFLDENIEWLVEALTLICRNGESREPMRKFSGGIVIAFLDAYFKNDSRALKHLLLHPEDAPVILEPPEYFVSKTYKLVSKL